MMSLSSLDPTLSMQPDWNGNGGQFKREIVAKKSDLFLKLRRNNWYGAILLNIESESRENENNIFTS